MSTTTKAGASKKKHLYSPEELADAVERYVTGTRMCIIREMYPYIPKSTISVHARKRKYRVKPTKIPPTERKRYSRSDDVVLLTEALRAKPWTFQRQLQDWLEMIERLQHAGKFSVQREPMEWKMRYSFLLKMRRAKAANRSKAHLERIQNGGSDEFLSDSDDDGRFDDREMLLEQVIQKTDEHKTNARRQQEVARIAANLTTGRPMRSVRLKEFAPAHQSEDEKNEGEDAIDEEVTVPTPTLSRAERLMRRQQQAELDAAKQSVDNPAGDVQTRAASALLAMINAQNSNNHLSTDGDEEEKESEPPHDSRHFTTRGTLRQRRLLYPIRRATVKKFLHELSESVKEAPKEFTLNQKEVAFLKRRRRRRNREQIEAGVIIRYSDEEEDDDEESEVEQENENNDDQEYPAPSKSRSSSDGVALRRATRQASNSGLGSEPRTRSQTVNGMESSGATNQEATSLSKGRETRRNRRRGSHSTTNATPTGEQQHADVAPPTREPIMLRRHTKRQITALHTSSAEDEHDEGKSDTSDYIAQASQGNRRRTKQRLGNQQSPSKTMVELTQPRETPQLLRVEPSLNTTSGNPTHSPVVVNHLTAQEELRWREKDLELRSEELEFLRQKRKEELELRLQRRKEDLELRKQEREEDRELRRQEREAERELRKQELNLQHQQLMFTVNFQQEQMVLHREHLQKMFELVASLLQRQHD